MSLYKSQYQSLCKFLRYLRQAVTGEEKNFTDGSLNKAIFMLSIPMVLEMVMESLFAVVDMYFVSKVSVLAVSTIALTEPVVMIIFAIAIGLSMSATAMVARRMGEGKPHDASVAASQAILLAVAVSAAFSLAGVFYAKDILRLMGAEPALVREGFGYTQIMLGGNTTIMMLFLVNAIFRGAGDAALAMRSLWLANLLNIALDPLFIFGWGPVPAYGVEGAAIATTLGRGIGVCYQLYALSHRHSAVRVDWRKIRIDWPIIANLVKVSLGGIGQYLIGTLSWLFLVRISASFGTQVIAGYAIAVRIIMFTILPSWGLSNAAATLVGQNLGAGEVRRAERSVWKCAFYNMVYLGLVSILFIVWAEWFVAFFSDGAAQETVVKYGAMALRYIGFGYVFYAYGMVLSQAFNGAGDTKTPTLVNLVCFWGLELPLAYGLAKPFGMGPEGIFVAVAFAVVFMAVLCIILFKKGHWKTVRI